jgi:parallel beta-helix repeat protein
MTEKALTLDGWGYYSWIIQAIYHAVDSGAKIISMSFGSSDDSSLVHDAVQYAYDHGVLLVAAAGNDGNTYLNYPAAYDEVIAVSATDPDDNVATFSSYGVWIELAAPGVHIYSTLPTYNVTLNEPPYNRTLNYDYLSGTSMACPHVAGVAALVWSAFPDYANYKIRQILKRTADDSGDVGFDEFYGYGRINAERAVAGILDHDLAISRWQYPYGIRRGEFGIFDATISNYGKSNETDIVVQFIVNQTLEDVKTVSSLENEASTSVTFSWSTKTEGKYNVTCYVVPVPGENYIENNVASSTLLVRPSLTLRVPGEYSTIKEALNNATEGDLILVDEGSYAEGQIDIFKSNVTLIGVGTVTLNGLRTKPTLKIVADFVTVKGFTVQNSSCGIYVQGRGNNITGNFVLNHGTLNGYCGIHLYRAFDSTICSNSMMSIDYSVNANVEYGILLESSSNNVISMNNASNAADIYSVICYGKHGIVLYSSPNNTVSFNNVSNSHNGIWIYLSLNNTFISNTATDSWCGILIDASPLNKLRNNTMIDNSANFGVRLDNLGSPSNAINDVDYSNTVNGKPICYLVNKSDASVPSDAGCVVLINCRRIKLQNLTLTYNLHGALLINTNDTQICSSNIMSNAARGWEFYCAGIWMLDSSNNTISQNNISYNVEGVFAYLGVNNTITSNDIVESGKPGGTWGVVIKSTSYCNVSFNKVRNTDYGAGICISSSNNNVVNSNDIEYGVIGLTVSKSDNVISSNNVSGCQIGISMYTWTSSCIIKSNNIVACQRYAVRIGSGTYGNKFFHNNFIGNTNVYFEGGGGDVWDNEYPCGGNYWSDYASVDVHRGKYQNETGSDGIGDTQYAVAMINNRDHYPLMKPYPWASHDVGVTSVTTSESIVEQGYNVPVGVMTFNYGNYTERISITVYVNETVIGEINNINISSRNFTITTLTWNTAGFAKGNYTISAYVWPIPDETDMSDNHCTGGLVIITMLGDFDGDHDIDSADRIYMARAYRTYWQTGEIIDIRCDFDRDSDIDSADRITLVNAYRDYWYP